MVRTSLKLQWTSGRTFQKLSQKQVVHSPFKNNPTCKDKLCSIASDFKKIFMHPWEIIKTIGPWAFRKESLFKKKSLSIFIKISDRGSIVWFMNSKVVDQSFSHYTWKTWWMRKMAIINLMAIQHMNPLKSMKNLQLQSLEPIMTIYKQTKCMLLILMRLGYMNNPKPYMLQLIVCVCVSILLPETCQDDNLSNFTLVI